MSDLYKEICGYDLTKREVLTQTDSFNRIVDFISENRLRMSRSDILILKELMDSDCLRNLIWVEHEQSAEHPCLYYNDGFKVKSDRNYEVYQMIAYSLSHKILICLHDYEYTDAIAFLDEEPIESFED